MLIASKNHIKLSVVKNLDRTRKANSVNNGSNLRYLRNKKY